MVGAGFLGRLFARAPKAERDEAFLALAVVASLLASPVTDESLDVLAKALAETERLRAFDWTQLKLKLKTLQPQGPRFSRTRARLKGSLESPEDRDAGAQLLFDVALSSGSLSPKTVRRLDGIAKAIGLSSRERSALFLERSQLAQPPFRWERSHYSDPKARPQNIFEYLARTESEAERALLCFKLQALHEIRQDQLLGYQVQALGPYIELPGGRLRLDAHLSQGAQQAWARVLAPGESLFPAERALWRELLGRNEPAGMLVAVLTDAASPRDRSFFEERQDRRLKLWFSQTPRAPRPPTQS